MSMCVCVCVLKREREREFVYIDIPLSFIFYPRFLFYVIFITVNCYMSILIHFVEHFIKNIWIHFVEHFMENEQIPSPSLTSIASVCNFYIPLVGLVIATGSWFFTYQVQLLALASNIMRSIHLIYCLIAYFSVHMKENIYFSHNVLVTKYLHKMLTKNLP